jgi:flagellar biosynthesis/type III secretory pathway protein FliH
MSNGIYLTLEQYKDKDLPLKITVNGNTYHSEHGWSCGYDEGFEIGKSAGYNDGFEEGKSEVFEEGFEIGKKEALAEIEVEFPTYKHGWSCGYNEGFEEGKSEGYDEGYEDGKREYSVKPEKRLKSRYFTVHIGGHEQCKQAGISNKEDYDKGYKVGYEAGKVDNPQYMRAYQAGRNDGFDECKRDSISAKEIPGESLAHIEEARLMGYEEGYIDAKEGGQAEGYIDRREKSKPMMESGDDEEDGEPIGPEHPEYDKGYYAGWEDGKNHIMQFIGQ